MPGAGSVGPAAPSGRGRRPRAAGPPSEFGRLLQLLDPDIRLRSDADAVALAAEGVEHGAPKLAASVHGRDAVARVFAGRAELARPILVWGVPAAGYVTDGTVHAVYLVTLRGGRVSGLEVLADPAHISALGATA
ncbi:hypothetical protein [Tessaracoccus terricola]